MKPFQLTPPIACRRTPLGAGLPTGLGAGLPTGLGAGLPTSPKRPTAGLPNCERSWPFIETFGRTRVRGRRPAHSRGRESLRGVARRGFTLVEMLVVLTVLVFLLASAALAIGTLFRAQGELQDELVQANAVSRLAAQLRADAHLATAAEIIREGDTVNMRLRLPDAEINYATHPRRIVRTVTQGENKVHREVFRLLEGTTAQWQISDETPTFITLTTSYVSPELREGVARPSTHRIEASIGLHTGGVK